VILIATALGDVWEDDFDELGFKLVFELELEEKEEEEEVEEEDDGGGEENSD